MCNNHDHAHLGDNDFLTTDSLEAREIKRRWPIAMRELKALSERIRDIQGANTEPLHSEISNAEKKKLREALAAALQEDDKPELKRTVVRKMADKIGNYLLWRRESSTPVIHELIVLLPWWFSKLPGESVERIRDIGLKYILNGRVVPVQQVWSEVLSAYPVYMGHCVCRSSGVVDDLYQNGRVFTLLDENSNRVLLDRFVSRYEALVAKHGTVPDTDTFFLAMCENLKALKQENAADYRLETLLENTYPHWEILPVFEGYTPSWIRSMHRNHKAHQVHRELVFELATIMYLTRGTIFSSMKLIDTPYTICSCPTPENGGGCTLTNWYYYGRSNESLLPNTGHFGRRTDEEGSLMPCRYFPVRAKRECMGCGCEHELNSPRNMDHVLAEADKALAAYQKRASV